MCSDKTHNNPGDAASTVFLPLLKEGKNRSLSIHVWGVDLKLSSLQATPHVEARVLFSLFGVSCLLCKFASPNNLKWRIIVSEYFAFLCHFFVTLPVCNGRQSMTEFLSLYMKPALFLHQRLPAVWCWAASKQRPEQTTQKPVNQKTLQQHKWFILISQPDACSLLHSYNPQNCCQINQQVFIFFFFFPENWAVVFIVLHRPRWSHRNTVYIEEPQSNKASSRWMWWRSVTMWSGLNVNTEAEHSVKTGEFWTWLQSGSMLVKNAAECRETCLNGSQERKLDK